jgi:hypothetical protein
MQSAFLFETGRRIIFETTFTTITVYHCDQNWQKIKEFANMDLSGPEEDYHLVLRISYLPKYFVEEQSTVIAN